MSRSGRFFSLCCCLILFVGMLGQHVTMRAAEPDRAGSIDRLVRQLNDDLAERRDAAEQALIELAPLEDSDECDQFLEQLPRPVDGMPAEVRMRLKRLRKRIEIEQAKYSLAASRLTIAASPLEATELFKQIEAQTGNRLADHRAQFGQPTSERLVIVDVDDKPFWPALDQILDAAQMTLYPFSGEDSLAVIDADQNAAPRTKGASYAGPFRIEAVAITSRRDLRSPQQQGTRIELEVSWEPRLKPIALSQSVESLNVIADDGSLVELASPQAVLNVEIRPGSHATQLTIPLTLPPRGVSKLASLKGKMSALVPGRIVELRFDKLAEAKQVRREVGGVEVTLGSVRQNQELWEVRMRLQVNSDETGLESHRGWVFSNLTYLLNQQGEIIDHAGFETTKQSEKEVGLTYLFELPDDNIGDYTWVYRTPASIIRMPVAFELTEIALP